LAVASSPEQADTDLHRAAKRELRQVARNRRNALSIQHRQDSSASICSHLVDLLPSGAIVMSYVAIRSEVDLRALAAMDVRVVLPRVEGDVIVVVPAVGGAGAPVQLVVSSFGVPEPVGDAIDPQLIDVVCVPGLALDRRGGRLGYGAGYYDRFLPHLRADVLTVGVGFSVQVVDEVPMDSHDRPVDLVITEAGVIGGATARN
jgi:5-formyltetrahydrofolate cyclo-ligase